MDVGIFTTLLCCFMTMSVDATDSPVVSEANDESFGLLPVKYYGQCYGVGHASRLACEDGYVCVGSKYYSYCAYASDYVEPYSQCGGAY